MIPADDTYRVPAADDPAIIADMVQTLGRDTADIRAALAMLSAAGSFDALDDAGAVGVTMQLLAGDGPAVRTLGRVVLSAYKAPPLTLYAIYPPTRHLALKVRLFIDFLVAHIS